MNLLTRIRLREQKRIDASTDQRGRTCILCGESQPPGRPRECRTCRAVQRALTNAQANGYQVPDKTFHQVAMDLGTYDSDLEGVEPERLYAGIHAWAVRNIPQTEED